MENINRQMLFLIMRQDMCIDCIDEWLHHLAEQFVLALKIIVYIAHCDTGFACYRPDRGIPYTVIDEFLVRNG